jgi:pyrroline-5-carboxylate reductase
MNIKSIGFIGGGRVTKIILGGFQKAGSISKNIVVSDSNIDVLNSLKEKYTKISITQDNKQAAMQDIVFVALHPPVMSTIISEIRPYLKSGSIFVSLATKLTIAKISEMLGGFQRIVRMTPNAPSIINEGYNPVVFSEALTETEKNSLLGLFTSLGESPVVSEKMLEAYAIITAMSPTYLWFQLYELHDLGKSFGLSDQELEEGILKTVDGTVKTMYKSGLSPEEVMDLIPVKPLGDEEENIKNIYRSKLEALYEKIRV